jgi:hypothetical protein
MRIGINVPDDLYERMEPLRRNRVTNVSQVCRDAIKAHVEAYERALARAKEDGMDSVAERLGNRLVPQELDWELLGIEDAKVWVQLAKVEDFEYLLHRLEVFERQGRSPYEVPIPRVQGAKFFEARSYEHEEWFDRQAEADEERNPYVEAKLVYQRGKISCILAVWNMAKEIAKRKSNAEAIARKRSRREARSQIEVPDHLIESSR